MTTKRLAKTSATITVSPLLLLAAFAGCENGGELEPPESTLGRQIIEAFAAHVGEDPSDIRVREGSWIGTGLVSNYPEVAEAIEEYVGEAGIAHPAWPGQDVLMPHIPGVIHGFWPWWWEPRGQRGLPGIMIGHGGVRPGCHVSMPLESLEGGGWRVGEPDNDCSGNSASRPWRLEDGKWVLDGGWTGDGGKLVMDPQHGVIRMEDPR